jgi:hypothetical protein
MASQGVLISVSEHLAREDVYFAVTVPFLPGDFVWCNFPFEAEHSGAESSRRAHHCGIHLPRGRPHDCQAGIQSRDRSGRLHIFAGRG